MRILIDECVPRKLTFDFTAAGHECLTVPEAGLAAGKNGELLQLAEPGFEIFLTLDKGLRYQQNITQRNIVILIIRAKSNRIADVRSHVANCLMVLRSIRRGEIVEIGKTDS